MFDKLLAKYKLIWTAYKTPITLGSLKLCRYLYMICYFFKSFFIHKIRTNKIFGVKSWENLPSNKIVFVFMKVQYNKSWGVIIKDKTVCYNCNEILSSNTNIDTHHYQIQLQHCKIGIGFGGVVMPINYFWRSIIDFVSI